MFQLIDARVPARSMILKQPEVDRVIDLTTEPYFVRTTDPVSTILLTLPDHQPQPPQPKRPSVLNRKLGGIDVNTMLAFAAIVSVGVLMLLLVSYRP